MKQYEGNCVVYRFQSGLTWRMRTMSAVWQCKVRTGRGGPDRAAWTSRLARPLSKPCVLQVAIDCEFSSEDWDLLYKWVDKHGIFVANIWKNCTKSASMMFKQVLDVDQVIIQLLAGRKKTDKQANVYLSYIYL